MGWFSRKPKKKKEASPGSVTIPEGHSVKTYGFQPVPHLTLTAGGIFVVNLGLRGDEGPKEFDKALADIRAQLLKKQVTSLIAIGSTQLSDLFAPNNPEVNKLQNAVVWVLSESVLLEWMESSEALEQRLAALKHLSSEFNASHCLSLITKNPTIAAMARDLFSEVAMIRILSGKEPVLLEVERPEKIFLSAPMGQAVPDAKSAESIELRLENLRSNLLIKPLFRAPHFRRLVLQAAGGDLGPLKEELSSRTFPLLLQNDAQKRIHPMTWPGQLKGLPVFSDLASLFQAGHETGRSRDQLGVAEFPSMDLLNFAKKQNLSLAFCAYDDAGVPKYYLIHQDSIEILLNA
ncbi:MAG: hypothetical protein P1V97_22520 [Planctomycetota bacterium]|nr:hypothetical protein [Planctomycetota bacterium]